MRALKLLLILTVFLAALAAGAYFLRDEAAGYFVRRAMAGAGLENPKAEVSSIGLDGVALMRVSAGPEGGEAFSFDYIIAEYDWRRLLSDRRVDKVLIGSGFVRLAIDENGGVSLPGVTLAEGERTALPFDKLEIEQVGLRVDAPDGEATGEILGWYDIAGEGNFYVDLEADRVGVEGLLAENTMLSVKADLAADGAVKLSGEFVGDIVSGRGAIREAYLTFSGDGRSWKDFAEGRDATPVGAARISLEEATVNVAEAPLLTRLAADERAAVLGAPISALSAHADIDLVLNEEGLSIVLPIGPAALTADNGAALTISDVDGDPLFTRMGGEMAAALSFRLNGAAASVYGAINAETTEEGWFVYAPIQVGEYKSPTATISKASAAISINTAPDRLHADITTTTDLVKLSIGRLTIADAPLTTNVVADIDWAAKHLTLAIPDSRCIKLDRAKLAIAEQDTEASFTNAQLCPAGGALAEVYWAGERRASFAGSLDADELRYRIGQTRLAGAPPDFSFSGLYRPEAHLTTAEGTLKGGAFTLNDMLAFEAAEGRFGFGLDHEAMTADVVFTRMRLKQTGASPLVAPVIGAGEARLADDKVGFDYSLKTPAGEKLGAGEGVHDVKSATGRSTFTFDRLEMAKGGVQPNAVAPVLKGIIGETSGVIDGAVTFAWTPGDVTSSATFDFEDVTFVGPTRVVERTSGVNGALSFASLWPTQTDGAQTLTIDGVSLFSLPLENGVVKFAMPGDETLIVDEAAFPWFGGELGVYEADMSISGARAHVPLRADKIDLKQILEFVNVEGLSGEGILSGVLPLEVENGRATIVDGVLQSEGPGVVRYRGRGVEEAAKADEQAQVAFDILRNLQYQTMKVTVNGPLDGRLDFKMDFEGRGAVELNQQDVDVPVKYRISLDAALLELLNQANLSRDIKLQIERAAQQGNQTE